MTLAIYQERSELTNRRDAVFRLDNAMPLTFIETRQKLWELGWQVLMHPAYNPDLVPSDYHFPLALHNFPSDKILGSREDCENRLLEYFANKADFYQRSIMNLLLKWQKIIQQNDAHFDPNRTNRNILNKA